MKKLIRNGLNNFNFGINNGGRLFNVKNLRLSTNLPKAPAGKKLSQLGQLGYEGTDMSPNFFTMTKLVVTVGPSSDSDEVIKNFVEDGMRVMRMNFSHATYDEAKMRLDRLRNTSGSHKYGYYLNDKGETSFVSNTRAALLDTKGPEIRTGKVSTPIIVKKNQEITVTTDTKYFDQKFSDGTDNAKIFVDYKKLPETMSEGDLILLNDGAVALEILKKVSNTDLLCKARNGGKLGSKKGVNIPGKILELPPLTDKDKEDLKWGIENDVDFIAQSFVRKASDVVACKQYLKEVIDKMLAADPDANVGKPSYYAPRVIAKIESAEALENFDEILAVADGIMVARGDLGVEIPFRKVTLAQKIMVKKCNDAGKPVIVATQMLESMISSPRPTRAEVSDVTNAIYDGADAVMLSGESANGDYPVESVRTMKKIMHEVDEYLMAQPVTDPTHFASSALLANKLNSVLDRQESVCAAAVLAANNSSAKLIIVLVRGGTAARLLSKYRPKHPIMAFCLHPKTARQLSVHRGIYPVVGKGEILEEEGAGDSKSPFRSYRHRHADPKEAIEVAKDIGWIQAGDTVVIVNAEKGDKSYSSSLGVNVVEVK